MTPSCLRLQVKHKRTICVWYGSSCAVKRLYAYGLISRSTSRPSRRFRTGPRQARRLGTSLASISRQGANTLLLVTLVDVFCYITSEIMMHTEGYDDQERYITSILYTCQRGAEECRSSGDESRITAQAKNRRQRQIRQEHPEIPDQVIHHEPKRSMRWVYVSVI